MQILSAKLFVPPLRSKPVARQRLFDKLDQGMEQGFVLVSAPAGYGKSTLINAWLRGLKSPGVWLTLDDGDNDPARFVSYLAAAFARVDPALGDSLEQTLQSHSSTDPGTLLTPLINLLAQAHHPICLVLDDYQAIQNLDVQRLVGFLLEHRPTELRLVIATRADPPLPLARLRARSEMVEIRQLDLRFTPQEASDFLNGTMELPISMDDSARITVRTEGWIAGLQMAALSMQNVEDRTSFIEALSGSHRFIFDYLLDEILGGQSPEIRRFLLYTSLLDQLTAPLCDALFQEDAESASRGDAVAGRPFPPVRISPRQFLMNPESALTRSSATILEELERNNLFILALDHERRWYRYHSLFAELLRGYLQRTQPEQIPFVHARASRWFEEQGLIAEAIHHALAAGEWEHVNRLISVNVFALLEQNELSTVARRLERMTSEENGTQLWLWIGRAWLAVYTGQLNDVEPLLRAVETEGPGFNAQPGLRGQSAAIRAYAAWLAGKNESAARAAHEALDLLDSSERMLRCQSATVLGLASDGMDARASALEQALNYARESSVSHVTIFAHGCWAYNLLAMGKLHEAHAACKEAIRIAELDSGRPPFPTLSHVYSTLSMIFLEWNDLDAALTYAREAVTLAHRWEQVDALHFAYTNLGSALFARGKSEEAFQTLQLAYQIARRTSVWFEDITLAQEVEWYFAQGNPKAVYQRLNLAQDQFEEGLQAKSSALLHMASIQFFLTQKQYLKALTWTESILAKLEKQKTYFYFVQVLVCQALAYSGMNQEELAFDSLSKALAQAVPQGYFRSFMVGGPQIVSLLQRARIAGIHPDYLSRLLAAMESTAKLRLPRTRADSHLVEPLSVRELEVLNLLARGFSDKKIAQSLIIASETVHKHLKNIYGKLDVHSRTEAVAIARSLGLLEPR